MFQFRVLARFGLSNDERSGGYGADRLIPLEELSAGTLIVHMRAAIQIELVIKCNSACGAAHWVLPFFSCAPSALVAASLYAVTSKKVPIFFPFQDRNWRLNLFPF